MSIDQTVKRIDEEDGSHTYLSDDGQAYDSVTTILKTFAQENLLKWASRQAVEAAFAMIFDDGVPTRTRENRRNIARIAIKEHERKAIYHANIGTRVHELAPMLSEGFSPPELIGATSGDDGASRLALNALYSYKAWFEEWNPTFLSQEETIFDHDMKVAGTYDAYGLGSDGTPTLYEFKTSRQIAPTHCAQAAVYAHMLKKPVEQIFVIKFDKYNPGVYEDEEIDFEPALDFFMSALNCFRKNDLSELTIQ